MVDISKPVRLVGRPRFTVVQPVGISERGDHRVLCSRLKSEYISDIYRSSWDSLERALTKSNSLSPLSVSSAFASRASGVYVLLLSILVRLLRAATPFSISISVSPSGEMQPSE